MRQISTTVFLLAVLVLLAAAPALMAQEPQLFHVSINRTQLGSAPDYEAGTLEMFAAAGKAGFGAPILASSSISNPGEYTFVVPFASWTQLGELYATWNKVVAGNSSVWGKINSVNTSNETSIWTSRPDLSYAPAKPRLTQEEATYFRLVWLYPHPDQVAGLEGVIKEFGAVNKKHGIDGPFVVFQQIVGADGPAFGIRLSGKNPADFHTNAAKNQPKTAADIQPLLAKMGPMMRKIEYSEGTVRPDLSHQP